MHGFDYAVNYAKESEHRRSLWGSKRGRTIAHCIRTLEKVQLKMLFAITFNNYNNDARNYNKELGSLPLTTRFAMVSVRPCWL